MGGRGSLRGGRAYVARARAAGAVPLLVAYHRPDRDCGGLSAGGAASPQAYREWIVIVQRLRAAGVEGVRGFSLNAANFRWTAEEIAYGTEIAGLLGGGRFVIDTGRNGRGPAPDAAWCNPPGSGLGRRPTAATGSELVDAFLWIKRPGESDGGCNGGPAAGEFWVEGALALARADAG